MPYTKKYFPNSMKNLEEKVRIKALDILNAMIQEGYDEEDAIPISISQAKSWTDNATEKELKEIKKKDVTKHNDDVNSNSSRLMDNDVDVFFDEKEEKWAVKSVGAQKSSNLFETKKEALVKAKSIANNRNTNVNEYEKGEKND